MDRKHDEAQAGTTAARRAPGADWTGATRAERWPGRWVVTNTFADGSVAHGSFEVRMRLGGRYLIGDYRTTRDGREFEGHSVQTRDPETGRWRSWWFDRDVSTGAEVTEGAEGPAALVLEGHRHADQEIRVTETWADPDEVRWVVETLHPYGWQRSMTILFHRMA